MLRYWRVIVHVTLARGSSCAIGVGGGLEGPAVALESGELEVAQDEGQRDVGGCAFHVNEMDEPVAPVGRLRAARVLRQESDELRRERQCIHHPPLRFAGVNRDALDAEYGLVGGETLVGDLTERLAVQCVGDVGSQFLEREMADPGSGLLVGREADADIAVWDGAVGEQFLCQGHDHGHARLVVRAKECRAVGRDDRVAAAAGESAIRGRVDDDVRIAREDELSTIVGAMDDGLHVACREISRRINVREKRDDGRRAYGRRNRREHEPGVVEAYVVRSKLFEFLLQHALQVELLRRRRHRLRRCVALGVDLRVADKSLF